MRILTKSAVAATVIAFLVGSAILPVAPAQGEEPQTPYRGQLETFGVEQVVRVECEVPWVCIDEGYPVDQSSSYGEVDNPDGPDYCQECYDLLGCDQDCYSGTKTCCTSANSTGVCSEYGLTPDCNQVTRVVSRYRYQPVGAQEKYTFSVIEDGGILYSFLGVGVESKLTFDVHGADRDQ